MAYKKFEDRPSGTYHYGKEKVAEEGHFFGPFGTEEKKDEFAASQAIRLQLQIDIALSAAQADGWQLKKTIGKSAFGAGGYVLYKGASSLVLDALGQRNYEEDHINWFVNQ